MCIQITFNAYGEAAWAQVETCRLNTQFETKAWEGCSVRRRFHTAFPGDPNGPVSRHYLHTFGMYALGSLGVQSLESDLK